MRGSIGVVVRRVPRRRSLSTVAIGELMSVKLLDNKAFYGYRVRRTVNGELFQEYFSLKRDGKRLRGDEKKQVEQEALARDIELERRQIEYQEASREDRCFHPDGRVKGISYLLKTEKSGSLTPIYQVGIASQLEKKTVCTSYSVNAHGDEAAWRKAVDAYAKHKLIDKKSKLYRRLLSARPADKAQQG